jgi:D-lactate dehydrogenase
MKIAFFDTKVYDRQYFDQTEHKLFEIKYLETKLNKDTASLAKGCDGVVAFVNDEIDADTVTQLHQIGIRIIAMRCAGYNNIDFESAFEKIHVVRVPAYSPYAVAEYAAALMLSINRKTHKAYNRTREFNFALNNLEGFDLHGKTIGIIGTGQIGKLFIRICQGFGMNVIAYDKYPEENSDIHYVSLEHIFIESDIISLHCPLSDETHYMINEESINKMKHGVYIINTSRGPLIESQSLLKALQSRKIAGAALDVYEEESAFFYEDCSNEIINDETLTLLVSMPNVLLTSHQAFLTKEALENIAQTTVQNLNDFFENKPLKNEICYQIKTLEQGKTCLKRKNGRCF